MSIQTENAFSIKRSIERLSKAKSISNAITAEINSTKKTNENHLHDAQSIIIFNFVFINKFFSNETISSDNRQRNQTNDVFHQSEINFKPFLFNQKFFHVKVPPITIVSSSLKLNKKPIFSHVVALINVKKNDKTFFMHQKNEKFSKIVVISS